MNIMKKVHVYSRLNGTYQIDIITAEIEKLTATPVPKDFFSIISIIMKRIDNITAFIM